MPSPPEAAACIIEQPTQRNSTFLVATSALSLRSFANSGFSTGVLLLLLTESSLSNAAVHAVVLALAAIVLAPLGGVLADRFSPAGLATADHYLTAIDSAVTWGYVLTGFNIGLLVGSFVARYLKLRNDIFWAIVFPGLLAVPLLMFYVSTHPAWFVCFAFTAGLLFDFTIIYGQSALIDGIPDRVLGTTSSITSITEQAGIALGYLLVLTAQGIVSSHDFMLAAALTTAGATVLAILIIALQNRRHRHDLPGNPWIATVWPKAYDRATKAAEARQDSY